MTTVPAPPIRFDASARYGASLATLIFAVYLQINTNFAQLVQQVAFKTGLPPDIAVLLGFQFAFVAVAFVVAFLIAPTTLPRRLIAAGTAVVLLGLWAVFFAGRLTGDVVLPGGVFLGSVLTSPAYVATLVAVLGWLIVRERPGLSYLVLLLVPLVGIIGWVLVLGVTSSGVILLTTMAVTAVIGIGAAWAARGIAALVPPTPAPAPAPTPAP